MKLILASASPRRSEIMQLMPFAFEVFVPEFDERAYEQSILEKGITGITEITTEVARGKGRSAYEQLKRKYPAEHFVVLSADTIVVLDNQIFGKGESREKSLEMLMQLNGRTHEVISAVCIISETGETAFTETSKVTFADSDYSLLERYVDLYRPFDKAGAYGIQDGGALLVDKIEGTYHNIMGLPLRKVYEVLSQILEKE